MSIEAAIRELEERGIRLALEGDRIKVRGDNPPDEEAQALIEELRRHREEIRKFLAQGSAEEPTGQPDYAGMIFDQPPPCWVCGAIMTETQDAFGRGWWACWSCAKRV